MRHYLDHASTTPPRPAVVEAMTEWLCRTADPGRVHTEGRMVRAAIEDARDRVAAMLGARGREIVFTSGGTEAANAAVWGARLRTPDGVVAYTAVEHSAVRDASDRAGNVAVVPVDSRARVDPGSIADLIRGTVPVALVSCQWANQEVGTLQPVQEIVEVCRDAGVLVHVDAVQAAGHVADLDLGRLGADLVSVSAHKFGGPPGVGALYIRRGLRLAPFVVGGDQERARRAGMENAPAIAGFGAAAGALGPDVVAGEALRARAHTDALLAAATAVPGVVAYGDVAARVPHIVCVGIDGVEAEAVLLGLDQAGIAAHSGSACSSESLEPSPVLEAMGVDAQRSLRVSVGWSTTEGDVDAFAAAFPAVVAKLRALAG